MPKTATSDPDAREAGAALRQARTALDLTQAQLAERLQVSPAYIQKLEGGRANPTVGQLANVARALGMGLNVSFESLPETRDPFAELAEL